VRLRDTTDAAQVTIFSVSPLNTQNSYAITHVVQVTAGTRSYDITIQPNLGTATAFDRNLTAIYFPVRY